MRSGYHVQSGLSKEITGGECPLDRILPYVLWYRVPLPWRSGTSQPTECRSLWLIRPSKIHRHACGVATGQFNNCTVSHNWKATIHAKNQGSSDGKVCLSRAGNEVYNAHHIVDTLFFCEHRGCPLVGIKPKFEGIHRFKHTHSTNSPVRKVGNIFGLQCFDELVPLR